MTEDMNQVEVTSLEVGETVKGTITKVEEKQVYVDVPNSKLDGIIPISELASLHIEKAGDVIQEGAEVEAKVIKVEDDLLVLSKRAVDAEKAWDGLEAKLSSGEVFEAVVKEIVKGGLVVDIGVRGFIPASLVETHFVDDFAEYQDQTLTVKVVELDKEKNRVILSHRAVVEEELVQQKENVLESLKEGQVLEGTVQRLTDFGAFVDVGGVDGLVHISQLSHTRVEKPSDVVAEGDTVKVKVLSVDKSTGRVSLSIKDTLEGPWSNISTKLRQGDVVDGTVKRLVSFGAFVEVLPGVEGLVHISQISHKHIGTPHEVLSEGEKVTVKVLDVNEQERRVSLSIRDLEEEEQEDYGDYELQEESKGFQLGDMIGDQLKKLR
ncbi:30S ribosomal protein S1 [Priestia aryabhattai]|jgi:small subunit ribosomal protein S1|uniref:30S ribosomal protein S1 n=2 Tax=Priestia TaxID=2800373 RepID=A0AA86I3F8_PRIMG|nr:MULTISPECIES: 30S ribosomal protein S1 [Priestia]MBK0008075.1 30S ribosomal protein S1 [Bacillus sp. S35]AUO11080.1 30S ribosomal protein S1 [Priestia megaterium]AXI31218.1 30S ribosomal protein S1 [Priestia megaterium]KJL04132.1 30S ribosomal protein S1 [Priestia aryabhattai B8W22]MBU3572608.1 30S ribosomal protein S1 [Priestia aryabhattai]